MTFKRLAILGVFFGLGALAWTSSHRLRIQSVRILLSPDSQEDVLFERIKNGLEEKVKVFEGQFFWQASLTELHGLVIQDKRIRRLAVYRDFPSMLRVEIEPHTPVLIYLARDGRVFPIANDGSLLPPVALKEAPDLPILRGEGVFERIDLREQAIALLESVPEQGAFEKKMVSEIFYTTREGFRVFVSGAVSEIKLGDSDFGPKISRIQKVVSYLQSQNIKGRVIDARFSKKVVVRVRNNP